MNDATTVGKSQRQRNSVAQQCRDTIATAKTIADENDGCNSQQKPSPNLQPRASIQAYAKATEKISPTSRQARTIAEAQSLQTKIDLSPYFVTTTAMCGTTCIGVYENIGWRRSQELI